MTNFFSKATMISYLKEVFPQVNGKFDILELGKETTIVKLKVQKADLRPGDTVSGPSMFLLADVTNRMSEYIFQRFHRYYKRHATIHSSRGTFIRLPPRGKRVAGDANMQAGDANNAAPEGREERKVNC